MRTLLICHDEEVLNRDGISRWLEAVFNLAGSIILREIRKRAG
jgi:hypothetical protein